MAYSNPEDQRIASKLHYEKNKSKYKERNRRYRSEINQYVINLKQSQPCTDCDQRYPYYVMDFDHISDKIGNINYLAKTGRIGALKREIEKCELVCSNCHRVRTFNRSSKKV
jgi:hypothetical protein